MPNKQLTELPMIWTNRCKLFITFIMFAVLSCGSVQADIALARRVLNDIGKPNGLDIKEVIDDKTIRLRTRSGNSQQINLDNLIVELNANPSTRHSTIYQRYLNTYREGVTLFLRDQPPTLNRKSLILIVRSQNFANEVGAATAPIRSIGSGISAYFALDSARSISTVNSTYVTNQGLTLEEAERLATLNLDRKGQSARIRKQKGHLNIWSVSLDGDHESSLALSPKLLSRAIREAGGPILIGIPARSLLIFMRADDPTAATVLSGMVQQLHSNPPDRRPISNALFFSDGPVRAR
jgi:uncharacterized protein YtpQ (UPF0354 family)